MKFKLDENFGSRTQNIFRASGHKVKTVRDQRLNGASDQHLFEACKIEGYCLVTLDLDFADVTRFPPSESNGIVVIRLPRNLNIQVLEQLVRQFLQTLTQMSVDKSLWIVEIGRIRVHQLEITDW